MRGLRHRLRIPGPGQVFASAMAALRRREAAEAKRVRVEIVSGIVASVRVLPDYAPGGAALRDQGADQVTAAAVADGHGQYLAAVRSALLDRIRTQGGSTLAAAIAHHRLDARPPGFRANALGAMILALARAGIIQAMTYTRAPQASRRAGAVAVWGRGERWPG